MVNKYVRYIGEGLVAGNLRIDHGRVFEICNRKPMSPEERRKRPMSPAGHWDYVLGFEVAPGIVQTFTVDDIDKRPDEFAPCPGDEPLDTCPDSDEKRDDAPHSSLTIDDAVRRACEEPTLADALTWIAVWETERVVKQAKNFFETGVSTASHGGGWDTCFKYYFKAVLEKYPKDGGASKKGVVESIRKEVRFMQSAEQNLDVVLRTPQALENLQKCAATLQKLTSDLKRLESETAELP